MDISALIAGQPNAIFGVGYSDTSLVGAYVMILLLVLVFMGVRLSLQLASLALWALWN
jgi:hypothetical protein